MDSLYLWLKALHIIAVISWMAGMFYLPRLFVYHTMAEPGSEMSETFKVMEAKLLRIIMNPAMILSWVFGLAIIWIGSVGLDGWLWVKLLFALVLTGMHGFLAKTRRLFEQDRNVRPEKFYRMINEVPTLAMIVIVILVIFQPF